MNSCLPPFAQRYLCETLRFCVWQFCVSIPCGNIRHCAQPHRWPFWGCELGCRRAGPPGWRAAQPVSQGGCGVGAGTGGLVNAVGESGRSVRYQLRGRRDCWTFEERRKGRRWAGGAGQCRGRRDVGGRLDPARGVSHARGERAQRAGAGGWRARQVLMHNPEWAGCPWPRGLSWAGTEPRSPRVNEGRVTLLSFISDSGIGAGDKKVTWEPELLRMDIGIRQCQKHSQ